MKGVKTVVSIGERFGRWTLVEHLGSDAKYRSIVKVKCDCGTIREVRLSELKYGASGSCGCLNKESVKKAAKTHGYSKTAMYQVWVGIKERCTNPNHENYKHYGGRGITMYNNWANDFKNFQYWCVKRGWVKGLQIDRIDNNQGYSPNNCRVTTAAVNSRNKRTNINITIGGDTKVLTDWCALYNIRFGTVLSRFKRGWPLEKLFIPSNRKK